MKELDRQVLPIIRTFRNTDVAALCKVWNAHYGDLGFECRIDPLKLELSCLAKPYFREVDLLVAEYDEQVVGFLHLGQLANAELTDSVSGSASIVALCIVPCDGEDSIAKILLSHAERTWVEQEVRFCRFKPMLPDIAFYLGFGPADSMMGATTSEKRVCNWITKGGFTPFQPTTQWELDLGTFRPPIDRIQIQIRRSAQVDRQMDEPRLPWWQACMLGHTEPTYFKLMHRSEGRLSDALFWSVASELQPIPRSLVWLWPPTVPDHELGPDQVTFLIGEACRQLQGERVDLVRTVASATDVKTSSVLRRLGFTAERSGMVFEKKM